MKAVINAEFLLGAWLTPSLDDPLMLAVTGIDTKEQKVRVLSGDWISTTTLTEMKWHYCFPGPVIEWKPCRCEK